MERRAENRHHGRISWLLTSSKAGLTGLGKTGGLGRALQLRFYAIDNARITLFYAKIPL